MNWREKIKSYWLYDGLTEADYRSIYKDIHEQNRKNLISYSLVLGILFAGLFVATFFVSTIRVNRLPYAAALVTSAAVIAVLTTAAKKSWIITCVVNYVFCTLILAFCTVIGIYTAPQQLAISFCVALVILPFITYDNCLRSTVYRLVMSIIFIVLDCRAKEVAYSAPDVINVISYLVLGTFTAGVEQTTQAQAFYLKRNMNEAIARETRKVENLSDQSITAMVMAIDAKDRYTNGHSVRVARYSRMLAMALGKTPEEQSRIYSVALLHDVGKIGIPDAIISKPGKLTREEYEIIKTHTTKGYDILKQITELPDIAIGARYHHEHYDGSGYPEGLKGSAIPETARIIAVADAYDAMTSNRSYRSMLTQQAVYDEIKRESGRQFDPRIAPCMLEIIRADKDYMLHE